MKITILFGVLGLFFFNKYNYLKYSNFLKKNYGSELQIESYEVRYDKSFLFPVPMGFSYIILYDTKEDFYFDTSYKYKKTKYTFNKDTREDLRKAVSEARSEEKLKISELQKKVEGIKRYINEDCFVIKNIRDDNFKIILFVSQEDLFEGTILENSKAIELYLSGSQKDQFVFLDSKYKIKFEKQILKGYFSSVEKCSILDELGWQKGEMLSSVLFLSRLMFLTYYKVFYRGSEGINLDHFYSEKSNSLQNIRGEVYKNYYHQALTFNEHIIAKPMVLMENIVKEKYFEKYAKELDMNLIDSFMFWGEKRLEYEAYDLYYEKSEKISSEYLKYDFVNDNFLYSNGS